MKIVVFGASKGIGRQVVDQGLARGHEVTAFARHPEVLRTSPKLRLFAGDVTDAESVAAATEGQDVVICTLGLPTRLAIGPPVAARSRMLTEGTANIIAAMRQKRQKKMSRLLIITAIGTGDSQKQCTPLLRLTMRLGLRWLFGEKDRQEELVGTSGLDWTIVRPTTLTNGGHHETLVFEGRAGLFTQISRADVAAFLLDQAESSKHLMQTVTIANPPNRLRDPGRFIRDFR